MENVNQSDERDEQEYCKDDANDQPYGLGLGCIKDCNHNVGGDLSPLNKGCVLGNVSQRFFQSCVCNTVYNVSNNLVLGRKNICHNLVDECLLVNGFGQGVAVSENYRTIFAVYNTYKNQVCRCKGEIADIVAGNSVGHQRVACGNGDHDFVSITVGTNLLVAVLIGVSNSVCGVTENLDHNVGCGHCECAVNHFDQVALLCTVDGLVNLKGCCVANLINNGNGFAFGCNKLIHAYITVDEYVVLLFYLSTVEINYAVGIGNEIGECVVGKFLALIEILPNVAGKIKFDQGLQFYKVGVAPLCNGVRVDYLRLNIGTRFIEVYSDGGLCGIDPEQVEILSCKSLFGDIRCAVPRPVAGEVTCGLLCKQICYIGLCKDGVGNSQIFLNFVVYMVEYLVSLCAQVSNNGYGFCGHGEGAVELGVVEYYLAVFKAARNVVGVDLKGTNFLTGSVVGFESTVEGYDGTKRCGKLICRNRFNCILSINGYSVLVYKSNGGEVRSVECNGCVGYFNSNVFTVNINKGLNVCSVLACEGQNDCNGCAILKFTNVGALTVISEQELVGFCTRGCICLGSILETDFFDLYGKLICIEYKQSKHLFVKSYLLCIVNFSGKNESVQCCNKFFCKIKFESYKTLFCNQVIPVLRKGNGEFVINKRDIEIFACYQTANLNSGVFGVLVQGNGYIYSKVAFNSAFENAIIPSVRVCIAEKNLFCVQCRIQGCSCLIEVRQILTKSLTVQNSDGSGLIGNEVAVFVYGNNGNSVFGYALNISLQNNILCRHYGYVFAGCGIHPTCEAFGAGVINHLGEVGAYGKESGEEYVAIFIYEINTVEVVYVNGNIKAGVNGVAIADEDIQNVGHILAELGLNGRCIVANQAKNSVHALFKNNLCIKGNVLVKYEGGVATVEVHQAVVFNNCTKSGSHETVCNADGVALYRIEDCAAVFYLILYSNVEVCERIGRCSCLLEQVLQIEIVAGNFCELIENIVNGVVEVAVHSVGQAIGDFKTGNVFEFLYEYFEGGNFSECIDKVLCFEVIG